LLSETLCQNWTRARSVNQTSASFVAKSPTATEPTGDAGTATGASVFDVGFGGTIGQNALVVMPYAIGSDNNTFNVRLYAWASAGKPHDNDLLWIPTLLCELACTCSTIVGIAAKEVLATERFADTIVLTYGNSTSTEVFSPANNLAGHIVADLKGAVKFELTFETGSSATSCNALWKFL